MFFILMNPNKILKNGLFFKFSPAARPVSGSCLSSSSSVFLWPSTPCSFSNDDGAESPHERGRWRSPTQISGADAKSACEEAPPRDIRGGLHSRRGSRTGRRSLQTQFSRRRRGGIGLRRILLPKSTQQQPLSPGGQRQQQHGHRSRGRQALQGETYSLVLKTCKSIYLICSSYYAYNVEKFLELSSPFIPYLL